MEEHPTPPTDPLIPSRLAAMAGGVRFQQSAGLRRFDRSPYNGWEITHMVTPWDKKMKRLVAHTPVRIGPPSAAPGFPTQPWNTRLDVGRLALGTAMARTGFIGHPAGSLAWKWAIHASELLADLVDDNSAGFELLDNFLSINGSERTALAGRIGAGMCDLLMQSLKYVWRDQASSYIKVRKEPLADFLYATPHGNGVVLAEAKGSTQDEGQKPTQRRADQAYARQVKPWLGTGTVAGTVVHGYAVSLRARVKKAAFLCVAETDRIGGGGGGGGPGGGGGLGGGGDYADDYPASMPNRGSVNASVAVGNYATVLSLVGRHETAALLRAVKSGRLPANVAAAALQSLEPDDSGLVVGRSRGSISPYSAIQFAVHPQPLRALAQFLASVGDSSWEHTARERITLPILPSRLKDEETVQFADGLVGISVPREQALATEALLPPEILGGAIRALPEIPRDMRLHLEQLREAEQKWRLAQTLWKVADKRTLEAQKLELEGQLQIAHSAFHTGEG